MQQIFSLVNVLLAGDAECRKRQLSIRTYKVQFDVRPSAADPSAGYPAYSACWAARVGSEQVRTRHLRRGSNIPFQHSNWRVPDG
jgi:hypothetical protein